MMNEGPRKSKVREVDRRASPRVHAIECAPNQARRSGKLGDAVKALPQSLAECIQDLPECIEYCIRKAGPNVNGYLFEKLLYDLIDSLVVSSNETQMDVIQDEPA